jgi:hypothetical protein
LVGNALNLLPFEEVTSGLPEVRPDSRPSGRRHKQKGDWKMPKYGVFTVTDARPLQEYEGDYMVQDKQFVQIWKNSTDPAGPDVQVAAIHLDRGQSVKEMKDPSRG